MYTGVSISIKTPKILKILDEVGGKMVEIIY